MARWHDERVVANATEFNLKRSSITPLANSNEAALSVSAHITIRIRFDFATVRVLDKLLPRRIQLAEFLLEDISRPYVVVFGAVNKV